MYRSGKPNQLAAAMNRGWAIAGSLGIWPSRLVTLEVRGRTSGRTYSFPLIAADVDHERYLVAMLGSGATWVANVRAAGGHAVIHQRSRQDVWLEEVPVAERAPILRRYVQVAPGGRPHIPVDRHAPVEAFAAVADDFPVFRIHHGQGPGTMRTNPPV
jgi:deazaflavin-dependent oxidoreductase (nitroreductase family)